MLFLLNGCGDDGVKRSTGFKGKVYFESNRFGGESYKVNTGTCYYDGKRVKKLYRHYENPQISSEGKKLIITKSDKGRLEEGLRVIDLEVGREQHYDIPSLIILKYKWSPKNEKIGIVAAERGENNYIYDIYIFDPETNDLKKITDNKVPKIFIGHFSFSPDGKKIAYGMGKTQKAEDGRIVRIIDVETGKLKELPLSASNVAWSPDGKTIAAAGTYYEPDGTMNIGSKVVVYDLETGTYNVLPRPEEKVYQYEDEICYSPDGTKIAFIRVENSGAKSLWMMDADGSNRKLLIYDGYQIDSISWGE